MPTYHFGLIGYPLGHSLSPQIHTAALKACSLEGNYSLFPVHPDDRQSLKDLLLRVRSGELQGLNVTIPHKQNVMQFLDELTPTARSIGAVNTISLRADKLIGDNTDAPGFLEDLKRFLAKSAIVNRKSAIVLGSGGAARAVVYALLQDGWEVTIAALLIDQARELADSYKNSRLAITNIDLSNIAFSNVSLIVNTTPVGMAPDIDSSPWPINVPLPQAAVYDIVYNPRETKLVREACSQGLSAATGLGMLVAQAALAFEVWTGHKPPREVLLDAVDQSAH
jgi:shikimate dehydrogenase